MILSLLSSTAVLADGGFLCFSYFLLLQHPQCSSAMWRGLSDGAVTEERRNKKHHRLGGGGVIGFVI